MAAVRRLRRDFPGCELVVVDGGSTDATAELAAPHATLVRSERGRARQMNAGARHCTEGRALVRPRRHGDRARRTGPDPHGDVRPAGGGRRADPALRPPQPGPGLPRVHVQRARPAPAAHLRRPGHVRPARRLRRARRLPGPGHHGGPGDVPPPRPARPAGAAARHVHGVGAAPRRARRVADDRVHAVPEGAVLRGRRPGAHRRRYAAGPPASCGAARPLPGRRAEPAPPRAVPADRPRP